jgi:hypothetical protein
MRQYKFRDETKVFTCTDKMARQAGEAGFLSAEHLVLSRVNHCDLRDS